ncbi:MAG: hypothetical protein AAF579_23620, partial [Cyanobacteria bacterium P01_C01_bin.118]
MAVVLSFASFILLLLISSKLFRCKREAVLAGLMAWAVIVTILTEGLSLVSGFNIILVSLSWLLVTIGLAFFLWRVYGVSSLKAAHWFNFKPFLDLPVTLKLSTAGVTLVLLGIGITALVAAPNHSDSMEYHLSRVMHWIQNGSVAHYPSHNVFQLYQNPWSE